MDITLYQITNGTNEELIDFKETLINYISNKKYSTKSITLLKTLKKINQELERRENQRLFLISNGSNAKKDIEILNQSDIKEIKVPSFLRNHKLLSKKRQLVQNKKEDDNDIKLALEKSFSTNIYFDDFSTNDSLSLYSVYFPHNYNSNKIHQSIESESCSQSIFSMNSDKYVSRCCEFDIDKLKEIDYMWVDSSSIHTGFNK